MGTWAPPRRPSSTTPLGTRAGSRSPWPSAWPRPSSGSTCSTTPTTARRRGSPGSTTSSASAPTSSARASGTGWRSTGPTTPTPTTTRKRQWYHRFQGFYFLFMLGLYWLSTIFNPQVLDLRQRGAQYVGIQMENDFLVRRRKYATMLRAQYI